MAKPWAITTCGKNRLLTKVRRGFRFLFPARCIPQGDCHELVELIDLAPTICDLAGVTPIENCDAKSLAPLLRGETTEHRSSVLVTMPNFSCIRTDQWKFIQNINDEPELYDLKADPEELHNLASSQPTVLNQMRNLLTKRLMEGGCQR